MTIALIDYAAGNLTSVAKGLTAAGASPRRALMPSDLERADAIVVPGVGHFGATALLGPAWRAAVLAAIDRRRPVLGICLGLQWLFEGSDEAPDLAGLGIFPGRCFRLRGSVKVPHVGWNTLQRTGPSAGLLAGIPDGTYAYFTHSYAAPGTDALATTTHGQTFAAAVERNLAFGVQFHPEKSGRAGLRILKNFVAIAHKVR